MRSPALVCHIQYWPIYLDLDLHQVANQIWLQVLKLTAIYRTCDHFYICHCWTCCAHQSAVSLHEFTKGVPDLNLCLALTHLGCSPTDYVCANGHCVDGWRVCNGYDECGDASDEVDCGRLCAQLVYTCMHIVYMHNISAVHWPCIYRPQIWGWNVYLWSEKSVQKFCRQCGTQQMYSCVYILTWVYIDGCCILSCIRHAVHYIWCSMVVMCVWCVIWQLKSELSRDSKLDSNCGNSWLLAGLYSHWAT